MSRVGDLFRLLAMATVFCAVADSALAARRVALVIGNSDYQQFTDLRNPGNDASDMAALLLELDFDLIGDKVHLDISRAEFSSLVLDFQVALDDGDVGLFYYAGHGAAYDGHNYLIPVNDQGLQYREQVPDFGYDAQKVLTAMRKRKTGTNLIILDACRDNPLPARVRGRDLGNDRGLASMTGGVVKGHNDLFIYAAEPGEKALDGSGRNGVFTGAFLKALRQPNLEIIEVLRAAAREVGTMNKLAPLPWWEGRSTEALVLNGRQRGPVNPSTPPAPSPNPRSSAIEPSMVVIPAGTFEMGSPSYEEGRDDDEGPTQTVQVRSFKLAKFEVTVGEFRRFVEMTGYRTDAEKNTPVPGQDGAVGCFAYKGGTDFGWKSGTSWKDVGFAQGEDHPVVCVSWKDAQAYIEWLNRETGRRYRLPSEAEQEYANRAGSRTAYAWGTDANQACTYANVIDSNAKSRFSSWPALSCDDGAVFTKAVGRYQANGFGLYDTIGNALEWSADCYAAYAGGARDSRAVDATNCDRRVLRGAGWDSTPAWLRVADRSGLAPVYRLDGTGFRLAEDL